MKIRIRNDRALLRHPALHTLVDPQAIDANAQPYRFKDHLCVLDESLRTVDLVCLHTAVILVKLTDVFGNHTDASAEFGAARSNGPSVDESAFRRTLGNRIRRGATQTALAAECAAATSLMILLFCDVPEPDMSFFTWLNLMAVEAHVTLIPVWTALEASVVFECLLNDAYNSEAHLVASLAGGRHFNQQASVGGGASALPFGAAASPFADNKPGIPALTDALSVVSGLQKVDVVRLINQQKTVAGLLTCDLQSLAKNIPGLSARKASKLSDIFDAPFPTTATRLHEINLPSSQASQNIAAVVKAAVSTAVTSREDTTITTTSQPLQTDEHVVAVEAPAPLHPFVPSLLDVEELVTDQPFPQQAQPVVLPAGTHSNVLQFPGPSVAPHPQQIVVDDGEKVAPRSMQAALQRLLDSEDAGLDDA